MSNPNLKTRFDKPNGFNFDYFKNDRGQKIRYGHIDSTADKSIGTLVLGPGYGEPTEKYFELIGDLAKQGYNIWIMDWMGQGGSDRQDPKDPERAYDVKNFLEHHRDDLYTFASKIVKAPKHHKLGYMGFSMGGHIGLRTLKTYNYLFDVASLSSAMLNFNTRGYPKFSAKALARALAKWGKPSDYVPKGGPWSDLKHQFNTNNKTHDAQRYRVQKELLKNNPKIRTGDPRLQWVLHAYPSIDRMKKKDILKTIMTPIFFSIPEKDQTVCVKEQKRTAAKLPNAFGAVYKRSKHEIWIEEDSVRNKWLQDATYFLSRVMESKLAGPVRFSRTLIGLRIEGQKKR